MKLFAFIKPVFAALSIYAIFISIATDISPLRHTSFVVSAARYADVTEDGIEHELARTSSCDTKSRKYGYHSLSIFKLKAFNLIFQIFSSHILQ